MPVPVSVSVPDLLLGPGFNKVSYNVVKTFSMCSIVALTAPAQ